MSNSISRRGLLRLGLVGAVGVGTATLTGCSPFASSGGNGGAAAGSGTLRAGWYGADPLHDAMAAILDKYREKNPSLSISSEHAPFDDYWGKLATQTAARNAPDVLRMSMSSLSAYGDRGALLDLTEYVDSGAIDVSGLRDGVRQSGVLADQRYGVGQSSIANAGFINPEAIDSAGASMPAADWTWDALANWAKGITSDSGGKIRGTSDQSGHLELFIPFVRQLGTNPFSDDGSEILFTPDMVEQWWTYWADLRKDEGAPPAPVTAGITGFENTPVVAGQTALDFGWVQQVAFLQPLMDQTLELVVPPTAGTGDPGYYINSADMWSVSATTKAADEAAGLIDYLLNDDFAITTLGVNLGVPPSDHAVEILGLDPGTPAGKAVSYVNDLGDKASTPPPPWPSAYGELTELFNKTAQDIAFGKVSPSEGAETYYDQATRAMAQA